MGIRKASRPKSTRSSSKLGKMHSKRVKMKLSKKSSARRKRRDYRNEYDTYYGPKGQPAKWTAVQKIHRKEKSARNKARAIMKPSSSTVDIDHIDGDPLNNSKSNLRPMSIKKNRGKRAASEKKAH